MKKRSKSKSSPQRVPKRGFQSRPASEAIRLNKFIANAGVCSRRDADELIKEGKIKVNGKVIDSMGYKVTAKDRVTYQGRPLKSEQLVYVLLNKPKDYITTTDDPKQRKTVMALVKKACEERIVPVGRLDRNTTGLLLFTNDGDLHKKLSHPSHEVRKIYHVHLDQPILKRDFQRLIDGVDLEDGFVSLDAVEIVSADQREIGLQLHSGRNRVVRRLFEHLGYEVTKLDRVMFAGLTKKDLPRGKWRRLTSREVIQLKHLKSG
jgi:23S rRNA pseudouridine2605 synthase